MATNLRTLIETRPLLKPKATPSIPPAGPSFFPPTFKGPTALPLPAAPSLPRTADPFFPFPTVANPISPMPQPTPIVPTPALRPGAPLAPSPDLTMTSAPPAGGDVVPYGFPMVAPETPAQAIAPPPAAVPSWVWYGAAALAAFVLLKSDRRIRRPR